MAGDVDPGFSSRLTVDLGAIGANYRTVAARAAPAACGAVVKANAYGLGVARVGPALRRAGCETFFVAHLAEADELERAIGAGDAATIFVLNGLAPGSEALCAERGFLPVLSAPDQIERWRALGRARGRPLPAALQVDSGMSRLGVDAGLAARLAADPDLTGEAALRLVMTHLACADVPDQAANRDQLDQFREIRALFPDVPASIANSGGVFLSPDFRCDLVRPGIALWGVAPNPAAPPLRPVARLDARVLQIHRIAPGTGVGYGLDYRATSPRRIATIGIGYGDGWPRRLGGRGAAWFDGQRLPIIGRVSMDSLTIDASDLPDEMLAEGDLVELIGPSQSLEDVARDAGTIAYEILTSLGARHRRVYVEDDAAGGAR